MILTEKIKRGARQAMSWVRRLRLEHWLLLALAVVGLGLAAAILAGRIHLYAGDENASANRYYLFSTIAQSLAAILALGISATMVATQMAVQTFGSAMVRHRLRDPWLWGALGLYLVTIGASIAELAVVKAQRNAPILDLQLMDLTLLLTGGALFYLVPFTVAVLRSLETEHFAYLLARKDYRSLEDVIRKAMNEGLAGQVAVSFALLGDHAVKELVRQNGAAAKAQPFSQLALRIGRYAAAKKDQEAIVIVMDFLARMTAACTQLIYRGAADLFNEAVVELYRAAEEGLG